MPTAATKRVFRDSEPKELVRGLTGACFVDSHAAAKQIALRFHHGAWLGIHLGMSGELRVERTPHARQRHDHLVLEFDDVALVYEDPRMFGRVRYSPGPDAPAWWTALAPPVLSRAFTIEALTTFLRRRARAPIKAVLLMQEQFPGIGNWMADEVLWRAAIHPRQPAGSLRPAEIRRLWLESRRVCRLALDTIAGRGDELPRDLNVNIPQRWLFRHRWSDRGTCPRTGRPLARAEIGGRTTCWSPARQKLRRP